MKYPYTPERVAEAIIRGLHANLTREAARAQLEGLCELFGECGMCLEMEHQHASEQYAVPSSQRSNDIEILLKLSHAFDCAANPDPAPVVDPAPEGIS